MDPKTAAIYIYYETFQSSFVSEVPSMTPDNLFSSIGGIVGILAGTSIISFCEILEIFFYVLYITMEHLVTETRRESKVEPIDRTDTIKVTEMTDTIVDVIEDENY